MNITKTVKAINAMLNLYTKNYKDFAIHDTNQNSVTTFSGAKHANKALPGDTVEQTETGCKLIQRKNHPPLVGLIELNSKTKYGFTSRNIPIYLFVPFNESYPPFVVGCSERDTSTNRLALIKFDSWLETFPRGNLQRLLPQGAEEEALSWNYTPLACTPYKGALPELPQEAKRRPRIEAFHIDPPGCKDVDDVLTIENAEDDTYIIITISDVAAHIPEDHPLDLRAQQIAQTFYQDGNSPRHVFPPALSEERLSLLPGESHLGLSLRLSLKDPSQISWFESEVQTIQTYTYESVYKNPAICETLTKMATALGEPTTDSHKWIEVAMKFYNQKTAEVLQIAKAGYLRCHDEPNMEKLQRLTQINPELQFLAYQSAQYTPANKINPYHFGLQTTYYTHATSPIRRYADLINQRVIKALLSDKTMPKTPSPYHLNYVGKQAKKHDRDLTFIRALKSAENNIVTGQIIELTYKDTSTKISVYVPHWQLMVKLHYTTGENPETIISKDEKTTRNVSVGQAVTLQYYADMTARSWKKRMVLRLV